MAALSNQDVKDILNVVSIALNSDHIDEVRQETLRQLERTFRSDKCTFFLANTSSRKLDFSGVVSRGLEDKWMSKFIQYFNQMDPHVPGLLYNPPVITTEQIVSFTDLVNSEYYNDFLSPQSIHFQMDMILRSGKVLLGALAFLRPKHAAPFSSKDKMKAQFIMQHLVEIVSKNMLMDQLRRRAVLFETVADNFINGGKIILDASLDIMYMDESAKEMLSLLSDKETSHQGRSVRLNDTIYDSCQKILKAARFKESTGPYEDELSFNARGAGIQITIIIQLIEKPASAPVFLIRLLPEKNLVLLEKRLADLGLTRREQEVLNMVCEGLKNTEIGEKLFISRYTVENHIKSIYRKLGVQNRTKLIHRVISLS